MVKKILTDHLSEPLNDARAAKIDIHAGGGNLTIDRLTTREPVLASGSLQYFEIQGPPARSMVSDNGQITLTLKGGRPERRWIRLPWAACNGAADWEIHLNPEVQAEIKARSDGGNIKLNLSGMAITGVSADTGGGNVDVVLPESAENMEVNARSGAGNVTVETGSSLAGSSAIHASTGAGNATVRIPKGIAARIQIAYGLGRAVIDPQFSQIDRRTYQSADFEGASQKVEITADSGAGNVIIETM